MIDSAGNVIWDKTLGGAGNDNATQLLETSDGGFVIAGYSDSDFSGDKSEDGEGFFDYWVVKTDSLGNPLWDRTLGGNGGDVLRAAIQTNDGGFLFAGTSNSGISGSKTEASYGGDDYWLVVTDSNGVVQNDRTIGGNSGDFLYDALPTNDGGVFLAGYSSSGTGPFKSEASLGSSDYWVLKVAADGTVEWDNTIGGSSGELLFAADLTDDNGYFLGGYSSSGSSADKSEALIGGTDMWVVKLQPEACDPPEGLTVSDLTASSAVVSWDEVEGALGYVFRIRNMTTGDNAKLTLFPPVTTLALGPSKISPGNAYIWQVRAKCPEGFTGWSETESFTAPLREGLISDEYRIYPNPNAGKFYLEFTNGIVNTIEVYDATGRLVKVLNNPDASPVAIDLQETGLYRLVVRTHQSVHTQVVVVQ